MGWRDLYYRKSALEKALFGCVVLLGVVVIVLFVCLLTSHDDSTCTTSDCIRAATHLLDTVDQDADPCEDFYAFACGNFMKLALSRGQPTTLHALNVLTMNQLKQIVVEDTDETGLPRTVVYQRKFYRACMDVEKIEMDGVERMGNLLDEVIGGWPVVKMTNWPEANFNWRKAMITARKLGLYHQFFFAINVFQNVTNDKSLLWIRAPSDQSFFLNETNVDTMHAIAKELGAYSVDVKTDLRIMINFAERLREISEKHNNISISYRYDERKNVSIKEIKHKLVKFDWLIFLKDITGIHMTEEEKILYEADDYLTDLYYLLLRTPKKVIANYIGWILLSTNYNYLPIKIRTSFEQLYQQKDKKEEHHRSEKCYKLSIRLFRTIAEYEYIRRYTTPEKKREIQTMIDYIRAEMKESIEVTQWLDEESRLNALERLENITTSIGWLDQAFNETRLEGITGFDKIKHFPENGPAIDMARTTVKIKFDKLYSQIRANYNELDNISAPKVEVNAYFVRTYNILILPAPILQGEIFALQRPQYMNYGALGTVIGHELTHGFSILNEEYDGHDIWSNATAEKRLVIAECVQNEYSNFRKDQGKEKDNATSTEENISDFNGVNLAYNAYKKWVGRNGRELSLPGIKLTADQIFWIMASTYMCYEPKLSEMDTVFGKDKYHGIPQFRVTGRIKNSPYFARAFNCPKGSRMNPGEKCRIFS